MGDIQIIPYLPEPAYSSGVILFIIGVFVAYPLVIMSQCYVYRLMNKPVLEDME